MPTGFSREELRSYARSKRAEYESVLEKIVEIPSVSVEPERKADTRRAAEYAVSLLKSFGGTAKLYETKGHPIVHGRFDRDPKYPTVTDLQPPRRAAGRGAGLADRALRLRQGRRQLHGPRHDRRQGAGHHGPLRRAVRVRAEGPRSTSTSSGSSRRRSAARTSRRPSGPTPPTSRPTRSSCPTPSGCRAAPRVPRPGCAACRASASSCRPARPTSTPAPRAARRATRSTELCAADRRVRGRQDRPREDPGLLQRRRGADRRRSSRTSRSAASRSKDFKTRPPLPLAARQRRARGDEAHLDDADLRGPRHRRRLPGPGRQDDHPAQGDGDRVVPARARHEPQEDRQAGQGVRQEGTPTSKVSAEHELPAYQGKTTGPYADAIRGAMQFAFGKEPVFVREGGSIGAVLSMEKVLKAPGLLPRPVAARARLPRSQRELRLAAGRGRYGGVRGLLPADRGPELVVVGAGGQAPPGGNVKKPSPRRHLRSAPCCRAPRSRSPTIRSPRSSSASSARRSSRRRSSARSAGSTGPRLHDRRAVRRPTGGRTSSATTRRPARAACSFSAPRSCPRPEQKPLAIDDYAWSKDGKRLLRLHQHEEGLAPEHARRLLGARARRAASSRSSAGRRRDSSLMFAKFSPDGDARRLRARQQPLRRGPRRRARSRG